MMDSQSCFSWYTQLCISCGPENTSTTGVLLVNFKAVGVYVTHIVSSLSANLMAGLWKEM